MPVCGHETSTFGEPLCTHLRTCREPWLNYMRWYSGSGLAAELLCMPCAESRGKGLPVVVASVCKDCFMRATREVGELAGIRGKPGILDRPEPFDATLLRTELPMQIGMILDIAPIQGSGRSDWLLLTADNRLVRLDADTLEWMPLAHATHVSEADREPWNGRRSRPRLHVSQCGEFAAVVNDHGRYGQVIDLRHDKVTLALDGGSYHENTVPFSFAFAQLRGRTVAIHRTDWNRLDISDPAKGELLTSRDTTGPLGGHERQERGLDYFHGALSVSPQSSHVFDDGWVWHPMGVPMTWSLGRWLFDNVWESEDGPTQQQLDVRAYYWGAGGCWIDENRFALAGIGDDDEMMIDGARVFDVTSPGVPNPDWPAASREPRELMAFPGPAGEFFSDGTVMFSSGETGLSRWSLSDGARTGHLADFRPTHHHHGAGELMQQVGHTLVRWRIRRQEMS